MSFTNFFTVGDFYYTNTSHSFACLGATLPPCEIIFVFFQIVYMNLQRPTNIVIPNKSIVYCCFRYQCIVDLKNFAHRHLIPCHLKSQICLSLHRLHNSLSIFWSKNIYYISRKKKRKYRQVENIFMNIFHHSCHAIVIIVISVSIVLIVVTAVKKFR